MRLVWPDPTPDGGLDRLLFLSEPVLRREAAIHPARYHFPLRAQIGDSQVRYALPNESASMVGQLYCLA